MPVRSRRSRTAKLKVQPPKAREGRKLLAGIVRLDYERAKGYVVRLKYQLTDQGYRPKFHQYFGDVKYGGKVKALVAAEKWLTTVTRTGKVPRD